MQPDNYRYVENLIFQFTKDGLMNSVVEETTAKAVLLALSLGAGFYFISLAWNYANNAIIKLDRSQEQMRVFSVGELMRVIVILLLIAAYTPVMNNIMGAVNIINRQTAPTKEQNSELEQNAQKFYEATHKSEAKQQYDRVVRLLDEHRDDLSDKDVEWLENKRQMLAKKLAAEGYTNINENDTGWRATLSKVANYMAKPQALATQGINAVISMIARQIKAIISILALIATRILIIIGPLALAFSIIPAFKEKMDQWFQTLLTLAFVFTTFNFLDHLMFDFMDRLGHVAGNSMMDYQVGMVFNVCMIIAYFMSFWFTSKWVGSAQAGRFVSKAVMFGTAAMGAAVSAGMGAVGGKMGAGAQKDVSNVIGSVKNLNQDDE
jgi:hypothetical protein